ncbi:uncharacterized protein LOC127790104 [Diospyros lotus]|uniref:uncharacterized protein LOC127790104 n=1 Tax=Diospyros lotus TaxID=55363 RepID=UPI002259AADC|nr:uncharacterized protein LOC127790104 [Diospyros lotus]
MKCSEDVATITAIFERDRVVEFLVDLNADFDQVRVQVLGKDKIPSLNEVFTIVRSEEYRRIAMLNETSLEGSAMAINKKDASWFRSQQGENVFNPKAQNKDGLWCSFCKKPRHTRETCFRLHGKEAMLNKVGGMENLQNFQPRRQIQAYQATKEEETALEKTDSVTTDSSIMTEQLNAEEISKLKSFLKTIQGDSCSMAQTGTGHGEEDWSW